MITIVLCAWHQPEFENLLPGFQVSHGLCPVCLWTHFADTMKILAPPWVELMNEGGWLSRPSYPASYWPVLYRILDGKEYTIHHCVDGSMFRLCIEGETVSHGSLTELLQ